MGDSFYHGIPAGRRRRPSRGLRPAGGILALVLLSAPLAAASHFEFSLSTNRHHSAFETVYEHSYSPGFLYGGAIRTSGQQTLDLEAGRDSGLGLGLTWFPHERFGVQLLYGSFGPAISGTTTPAAVSVTYVSMQPPDYVPREFTHSANIAVPAPQGSLSERAFCLNALVRFGRRTGFCLDVSAGVTYFRVEAEVSSLAYQRYWLGGHSVLFSDQYLLRMAADPKSAIGGNAGAEANLFIGPTLAVFAEVRYHLAGEVEAPVRFELIEDGGYLTPIDPAAEGLAGAPLVINPSFLKLGFGLKLAF